MPLRYKLSICIAGGLFILRHPFKAMARLFGYCESKIPKKPKQERWKNGIIPFEIEESIDEGLKQLIISAVKEFGIKMKSDTMEG